MFKHISGRITELKYTWNYVCHFSRYCQIVVHKGYSHTWTVCLFSASVNVTGFLDFSQLRMTMIISPINNYNGSSIYSWLTFFSSIVSFACFHFEYLSCLSFLHWLLWILYYKNFFICCKYFIWNWLFNLTFHLYHANLIVCNIYLNLWILSISWILYHG